MLREQPDTPATGGSVQWVSESFPEWYDGLCWFVDFLHTCENEELEWAIQRAKTFVLTARLANTGSDELNVWIGEMQRILAGREKLGHPVRERKW